jgi:hypothetical protein
VVEDRGGQRPRQRRESSRVTGADVRPVRVLLPLSKYELVERMLEVGAAIFTIAAALAPLRGVALGTLALLGVAAGVLALAAAVVGRSGRRRRWLGRLGPIVVPICCRQARSSLSAAASASF